MGSKDLGELVIVPDFLLRELDFVTPIQSLGRIKYIREMRLYSYFDVFLHICHHFDPVVLSFRVGLNPSALQLIGAVLAHHRGKMHEFLRDATHVDASSWWCIDCKVKTKVSTSEVPFRSYWCGLHEIGESYSRSKAGGFLRRGKPP